MVDKDTIGMKADNPSAFLKSYELICSNCGRKFILRRNEQGRLADRGQILPKNCIECKKADWEQRDKIREQQENQCRKQKSEEEKAIFHERLKAWNVVNR